MSLIFNNILNSYTKELPFVVYRKPNSEIVSGFFQENNDLFFTKNYTESGFVFAPFNDKKDAILIPKNQSNFLQEKNVGDCNIEFNDCLLNSEFSKENHIELLDKTLDAIYKGDFKKLVISRKESVELKHFNLLETYQKLLLKYSNALVYVWFHPRVGLWLGATPETLLNATGNSFKTMSLAGTQVYEGTEKVTWKSKEIEEQLLVTEFIKDKLSSISTNLQIGNVETTKAGNLLHLKTKISGKLNNINSSIKTLIKALHPTPAVCGLPREKAKKFIIKNENYKRTFYTGFLGELNLKDQKSTLYVNLRCMEIIRNSAKIFIGGGITKDSNPEKEWEETVNKSKVMKTVL